MTSRSTGWQGRVSSGLTGCTRIISRWYSRLLAPYHTTLDLLSCMRDVYWLGLHSDIFLPRWRSWRRIPFSLVWSWAKLLRSLRGFAYRHLAASWLLGLSLTLLSLFYFMPSRSQFEHVERGVGFAARVFSKVNILFAVTLWLLATKLTRREDEGRDR